MHLLRKLSTNIHNFKWERQSKQPTYASHLFWKPDATTAFILNLYSVTPSELSAEYMRNEDCTHYHRSTGTGKTGGEIHGLDGEHPGAFICRASQAQRNACQTKQTGSFISSLMSSFLFLAYDYMNYSHNSISRIYLISLYFHLYSYHLV